MNGKEFLRFWNPRAGRFIWGGKYPGFRSRGIALNSPRTSLPSSPIIGPVGSGKSLLALHLASRYLADHLEFPDLKAVYLLRPT